MMDPMTKQCRSFCFVTFVDKSCVENAVKQVCTRTHLAFLTLSHLVYVWLTCIGSIVQSN